MRAGIGVYVGPFRKIVRSTYSIQHIAVEARTIHYMFQVFHSFHTWKARESGCPFTSIRYNPGFMIREQRVVPGGPITMIFAPRACASDNYDAIYSILYVVCMMVWYTLYFVVDILLIHDTLRVLIVWCYYTWLIYYKDMIMRLGIFILTVFIVVFVGLWITAKNLGL